MEARARVAEFDAKRVAVERANAFDLAVIVELRALQRRRSNLGQAEQLRVFQQRDVLALELRVVETLDRVHVVLRDQLASLTFERRVVLKVNARAYANRDGREVGRNLRQRFRSVRHDFRGTCDEVVRQRCVENVADNRAGVEIVDLSRVKACLSHTKRIAQNFWPAVAAWAR